MAININRDRNNARQRTRTVFVPVNVGGGGGTQEKIKVGEMGIKLANSTFTEVPDIFDFSDVTDMSYMFIYCGNLQSIPEIDTSNVTSMYNMFASCSNLQSIPKIDTSNVTDVIRMFIGCKNMNYLPEMDFSNVTGAASMLSSCTSLTDLGGFVGLKTDIHLSDCPLTHDSIMNVINKAADVTAAQAALTLGSTNLAKITDEEKAIATNKGWFLA